MMNKKKKSVSRRETVSGKDPRKKHGMFEKLKVRVTKAKRRAAQEKVEKQTSKSFLILRVIGNHFKVLLKTIKERSDETSFLKNYSSSFMKNLLEKTVSQKVKQQSKL